MKVIAFITDYAVVDRIINHLKLTFSAERPPPHMAYQEVLMAAARLAASIFRDSLDRGGNVWLICGGIDPVGGLLAPPCLNLELSLTSDNIPIYYS